MREFLPKRLIDMIPLGGFCERIALVLRISAYAEIRNFMYIEMIRKLKD